MSITLGTLTFDEDLLVKQLRGDMKDDWFLDPLRFKDMIGSGILWKILDTNYSVNNGQYSAHKREIYNIPKPNLTLRYGLETGLSDRFLYHALVSDLVPLYDPLLGPSVYGHRHGSGKSLFKNGIVAWDEFIGSVSSALGPSSFLLSTDLTNYFEAIDLDLLRKQLAELVPELSTTTAQKAEVHQRIELLFGSLQRWTFNERQGLPQNRDASSFLANIFMCPVDREMAAHGYKQTYFRYMDDIKIVCGSEVDARLALKRLILALRDRGLSVNAKKTVILGPNEKEAISECLQHTDEEVKYIHSIWKTNSPQKILDILPTLQNYTLQLMAKNKFDTRAFRFCIGRLCHASRCPTLVIRPEFFEPVTEMVLRGIESMPSATDQIVRYLRSIPTTSQQLRKVAMFLMDAARAIYNWQNYLLWLALTDKKYKDDNLLAFATEIISSAKDSPSRAGATLYLGSLGDFKDKEVIAKRFSSLETFLGQRTAIIGVHELDFDKWISVHVKPYLRADLVGAYRELRKTPGTYCTPLEPTTLGEEVHEEVHS